MSNSNHDATKGLLNNKFKQPREFACGIGCFRPRCLQIFATPKWFIVFFGILGTIQGMSTVYFISTLTTMERRFGFSSKVTGYMLSGNEISQICLALVLSYTGGQRNRPVWLACGVLMSAMSCFILASPHFLFGAGEKAMSFTREYREMLGLNKTVAANEAKSALCSNSTQPQTCKESEYSLVPALLVFLSQFVLGIGTTLYHALGQTYMDDNTKKTQMPMLLGITMSLRTAGPVFAFILSYVCLSTYVDPTSTPLIPKDDVRWIGAWWIGWLFFGSAMLVFAVIIGMFPRTFRKQPKEIIEPEDKKNVEEPVPTKKPPTFKDFPKALKRLLKNKILMANLSSATLHLLAISGHMTYMNKYIEIQFEQSSASSSGLVGPFAIATVVLGFLTSGYILSKYRPHPSYVLGWNVFVGSCYVIFEVVNIFIRCENSQLIGFDTKTSYVNFTNECNAGCHCDNMPYSPVCWPEKSLTFYSACHAGCRGISSIVNGKKLYDSCSCLPGLNTTTYEQPAITLKEGVCPGDCSKVLIVIILMSCVKNFLTSSGRIGNILVNYRSVHPEDKAFAQGLALFTLSLLSFIPGPIIFGYLIDATCIIWDRTCGKEGNCWFYDRFAFRRNMNLTTAGISSLGVMLDVVVWYLGRDLKLYGDDEELAKEKEKKERKAKKSTELKDFNNVKK